MKKINFILLGSLLFFLLLLSGCGETPAKTKNLLLCSSLGEQATKVLAENFQKKTGIKVVTEYLPGGSTESRMKFLEAKNYDCWLGGTAEEYNIAGQHKLLEKYTVKDSQRIPAELSNKQGDWTCLYLNHIAFVSNKNKLREKGVYAPETWEELLKNQYYREIVIPDCKLGGASFGMITSIWQLKGKEQALNYGARLHKQLPVYTQSVDEAVDMVYRGEKTITVVPISYALTLEEKHSHLFATVIRDANRNMLTGVALMKSGHNKLEAQSFMDYLMSDESMDLLERNSLKHLWHVVQKSSKDERKMFGRINTPVDDLNWTATYKDEIIRQWMQTK